MTMRLWRVGDDGDWDRSDVMGADGALEAARKFIARLKVDQSEEVRNNRSEYDAMVERGDIDPAFEPFEESGYQCRIVLPSVIHCVPMHDLESYHSSDVSSDVKYAAQAFDELWAWDQLVEVRL